MARTPKATATVKPPKPTPGSVLADALISYGEKLGQVCELLTGNQDERREWHREAMNRNDEHLANTNRISSALSFRSWLEALTRLAILAALITMLVHWW